MSQIKNYTERLTSQTNSTKALPDSDSSKFMKLGNIRTENRKWISPLWFDIGKDTDNKMRIQLPVCHTKSGIIETSTKTYTDLLFDNSLEDVKEMVNLFLAMEAEAANQLHEHSDEWFSGGSEKMTKEDFEDMFTSSIRLLNRQANVCVRVNIPCASQTQPNAKKRNINLKDEDGDGDELNGNNNSKRLVSCEIYNRRGETRALNDITSNAQILPLVEIAELHMSSTSINLHVNLIECMIIKEEQVKPLLTGTGIRRINLEEEKENENENENEMEKETETENENVVVAKEKHQEGLTTEQSDEIKSTDNELSVVDTQGHISGNENGDGNGNENGNENNEISNELEEVEVKVDDEKNEDGLEEIKDFDLGVSNDGKSETITLKNPDEVYREIYRAAISKAKKLRQVALEAYLDAKKIKARFMLDDTESDFSDDDNDSEEDDSDDYESESENEEENDNDEDGGGDEY